MWTKRIHYLTEVSELSDYLKKVNNFTDCIISSFSFNSEQQFLYLTIEEDKTSSDFTNSSSLVWDLMVDIFNNSRAYHGIALHDIIIHLFKGIHKSKNNDDVNRN